MSLKLNAKKRITQLLIALVVVALTATGSVVLFSSLVPEAKAVEHTVTDPTSWSNAVNDSSSSNIEITLGNDISVSGKLAAIPSGKNVTLDMNTKKIEWKDIDSGDESIMSTSYTMDYKYWGLIEVGAGATLKIENEGTIAQYHVRNSGDPGSNRNEYIVRTAAIVNKGNLEIGSGVKIFNFAAQENTGGTKYQDMFVYSHGVYNADDATLKSSGVIQSGAFGQCTSQNNSGTAGWATAYSYGIFGGNITVEGGRIYSEAKSGFTWDGLSTGTMNHKNKAWNFAVGVYGANAVINGNTYINTKSSSWSATNKNAWKDSGENMSWGVGVLYPTDKYPTIGMDVNIDASFYFPGDNERTFEFPELNRTDIDKLFATNGRSDDDAKKVGRRAYSVAGIPASNVSAMGGTQTSEIQPVDALGVAVDGNASSTKYRTTLAATNEISDLVTIGDAKSQSGNNEETPTSTLTMGGPSGGGQYMVYYRYYNANGTLVNVTATPDTSIVADRMIFSPANGAQSGGSSIAKTSGGNPKNPKFYELDNIRYYGLKDGEYGTGEKFLAVSTYKNAYGGTSFKENGAFNTEASKATLIFVDYEAIAPSYISVVSSDSVTNNNKEFEVEYTGKTIVPGSDFKLGVLDMGNDISFADGNAQNYKFVTEYYALNGDESGKLNLRYGYKTYVENDPDAENPNTYTDGLPKNAGSYRIKVVVPSDTDISRSGSGNRNGGTFYLKGTIRKATPSLGGSLTQSGTYGSTIAELIPTDKYTITGKSGEQMTGTWTYGGYAGTDYPEVGTGSFGVNLKWTPTGDCASNYNAVSTDITVSLSKRNVTVTPAASTVIYGTSSPVYALEYSNLATCDENKKASWLSASEFEVSSNGQDWGAYSSTLLPGEYQMRIKTFGGDTANNNFTTSGVSKLTISRAPIYYTAKATNKVYDGNTTVDVVLTYKAGAVNQDNYAATLTTTGTVANANAGTGKTVTVKTDIDFVNDEKYYIAVETAPSVTISKATPEVSVKDQSLTYDVRKTLSDIAIDGTASVAGTWEWENPAEKLSVDKSVYKAVFKPTDSTNYNDVYVDVNVNVAKAEVIVSVENKTIAYGDASPALPLIYTFPDGNKIENVTTTGSIGAETTYSRGNNVGTYPVTITMTDYDSVNYVFTAKNDCVLTVEKKVVAVTAPSKTVTYGDAVPQFMVDELKVADGALYGSDTLAKLKDEASFAITTEYAVGSPVGGTYKVTVSANETTNYKFTSVDGYVTVTKATLKVTADNKTINYNDATPSLSWTITGYKVEGDSAPTGAPVLTTSYMKGSDAGTYAITVAHGTLTHNNYNFELANGVLTVNKLTLDTSDVSVEANIVHDTPYADAVFSDNAYKGVGGTFALKDKNAVADYTKTETDVFGRKYVTVVGIFYPTDSDNYNNVEITVNLFISAHEITGAPVIQGTPMVDSTITANVAGMTPSGSANYTYTWYVGGIATASGATYTVKEADVNKSIYVEVVAVTENGYTGTAKSASVTAVEKFSKLAGEEQLDIVGANATYTYNGNSFSAEVSVKSEFAGLVSDKITVYYNGSTTEPSKAGTYIVTIDVGVPNVTNEAERDKYYGPVSGLEIGTITIEKATITATFSVADKIYDGTRKVYSYNVVKNEAFENDDVNLDASALSIVFAKANVGEQKIEITGLKLAGNDIANYQLVVEEAKANITPATLTAHAVGVKRAYNGSVQVDVTFENITGYAAIDSSATVYFARATANATSPNVGTQGITNIRYELGGSSKDNYVVEIANLGSATVVIEKATPNVVAPVVSGLVYDANRTLANIILTDYYVKDSNGYWQFDDTTVVPTVRKTAYAATYISTNDNYDNYSTTITVNVTPKEVTLTAQDVSVSYGKAASFAVTADGFTGTDSLATMGGTQPSYVCSYYMGCSVGKYAVSINHNLDSHGNYTFKTVDGTLTVIPAELYATATATDRDYNGSTGVEVKFAITSGKYSNDDVVLSTTTANGVASSANAGTRTVAYTAPTLSGAKAANYTLVLSPASGILSVTINKLDPTGYVFPTSATIPFGYALSWAEFSDDAQGDGTFAFSDRNEVPDSIGDNYMFEVTFTPTDSTNYNTVSKHIPLTVTECVVNYVVGISGTVQVGQRLTASFTGLPTKAYDFINYQWYRNTDNGPIAISGANTAVYSPTEADVGYTLVCFTFFDANDPYVFEEGIADILNEIEGIMGETDAVEEENLTFWQRLVRWLENLIQALTGIMWSFGM